MSHFGGHVQLVTTADGSERRGVTITAACSVSDRPPCVLVCLNNTNPRNQIFFRTGYFGLNTLGAHHQAVADAFSGKLQLPNDERFATGQFETLMTGAPILMDSLAAFDCRVTGIKQMSTHHILFGEVVAVRFDDRRPALFYMNRDYRML
ncbi:flavin reductase family protein [Oryzifoliimicrobium ureilyticus]|uniref:flavin reductase family protein n=1 Tax=Oryzifoliimicrobium ureilyticus TaxID=3113724 RepID=UPI00307667FC